MCVPGLDPITIAALAASAAGTAVNGYEQNQTQNSMIAARNAATRQELARQAALKQEAQSAYDATAQHFQPDTQAQDLKTNQADTTQAFTAATPTAADVGTISTTNAPRVVKSAESKKVGDVFSRAGDLNASLGTLRGYDQQQLGNKFALNTGARNLGTVSDFARTSAAVNGLEQNAAYQNAYKPNSGIGDLLTTAGNIGAYGSGKGWFNPATKSVSSIYSSSPAYMAGPGGLLGHV